MSRSVDTDLLPWIMGGLMGAMAVAVIVGNAVDKLHPAAIDPAASASLASVSIVTPVSRPTPAAMDPIVARIATANLTTSVSPGSNGDGIAKAVGANTPDVTSQGSGTADAFNTPGVATPLAPVIMPTPVPPSARSELPPGQVWECVLNGQRTFSDSPCGDRPAIRQLSEINTMAAIPVSRAPRYLPPDMSYPGVPAGYAPDSYAPDDAEEPATDSANGVSYYPVAVVPYRYGGHGPIAALQPSRRGPQTQNRATRQPRAVARSPGSR